MNLSYTKGAVADLDGIYRHIAQDDARAADRVVVRITQSIAHLELYPLMGRQGRVLETRELSVPGLPYIAIYRIVGAMDIDIVAIVHASQRYP